jgi:hypothetical protein
MVWSRQRWGAPSITNILNALWESSVMRALVIHQPGGPEAMRLQQLPAPQPGPHQVVIAVEAVGVNPVDAATAPTRAGQG